MLCGEINSGIENKTMSLRTSNYSVSPYPEEVSAGGISICLQGMELRSGSCLQGSSAPNPPLKELSSSWSHHPRETWREQAPCPTQPWLLCSCRVGDAQRLLEPLRKPGLKSMTWIFLSGLMGFILPNNTRNPGPSVTLCFSLQVQLMFQEIPLLHEVFPELSPWGSGSKGQWMRDSVPELLSSTAAPTEFWLEKDKSTSWLESIQPCVLGSTMDKALPHMVLFQSFPYCWKWGNETKNLCLWDF